VENKLHTELEVMVSEAHLRIWQKTDPEVVTEAQTGQITNGTTQGETVLHPAPLQASCLQVKL